ncbi:MAG: hypothetical protein Q4D98_11520 [Planctomycetia bacterium]|nr:hypothetical protein [Planctomycetia bacterium]
MHEICASGRNTSPDFWGEYRFTMHQAKRIQEDAYATVDFLSNDWNDVLPEIQNLLVDSRETFELLRSMGIDFLIDVGVFGMHDSFEANDAIKWNLPADFWSLFLPYQGTFCVSFYSGEREGDCLSEHCDAQAEQKALEKRWSRNSFLEKIRTEGGNS